jgi:hypothetical protein
MSVQSRGQVVGQQAFSRTREKPRAVQRSPAAGVDEPWMAWVVNRKPVITAHYTHLDL